MKKSIILAVALLAAVGITAPSFAASCCPSACCSQSAPCCK